MKVTKLGALAFAFALTFLFVSSAYTENIYSSAVQEYHDLLSHRESILTSSDGLWKYFLLSDQTVFVQQYEKYMDEHVTVPEQIDGHPVVGLGHGFLADSNVRTIDIPDTVRYVGSIGYSSGINSIQLPDSVEEIFGSILPETYLSSIELPAHLKFLCKDAFIFTDIRELTLPDSLEYIGGNPLPEIRIEALHLSENHPYFELVNGMLISKQDHRLLVYVNTSEAETCLVPEGVEIIEDFAFCMAKNLKTVILPDSVSRIEQYAFEFCTALEHVRLPKNSIYIDENAFYFCNALSALDLPTNEKRNEK